MSTSSPKSGRHSADVRMELRLNGQVLPMAQLGPTFFILAKPIDHPPAEAEIFMSIDGHERQWPVYLPNGIAAEKKETPIAAHSSAAKMSTAD